MASQEKYLKDSLIEMHHWSEEGKPLETELKNLVLPTFPAGIDSLKAYLVEHCVFPEEAKRKGIQGKVIVAFVINKDGSIDNVEVVNSVHEIVDIEAVKVVKSMPNWKPGRVHNFPVKVSFKIPINFSLK
ncbi:MAG: energy transducer TonB [Flavobacteriales bacterium]|nr:energy transducer TonB [Flavobacteriales bacterium]